ncbi:thiamine phosphate synthase [Kangiella sp. HZ709]|uniref:thiamine phosphate synthase n=1 Tax=Kangiella sp. HZ709 TaxID=2666328 RepID=UPI0012AFF0C5|nr:thiamine phosphate synthase [Kangiella sp. HZ709]MRX27996.1 thiamine phosphate synthase [Kangiella sp. HZ709]
MISAKKNKSEARKRIVWSVAGSDCSGLAGQVADIRAIEALGAHPCMITTAVTAQNSKKVVAINPLSEEQITAQFNALKDDLPADAIKVGLLPSKDSIEALKEFLKEYEGKIIVDPVMVSSSGKQLMDDEAQSLFKTLFDRIDLLTPNIPELELLTGRKVNKLEDIEFAVDDILSAGIKAVLVKGGHTDEDFCADYFCDDNGSFWLRSERQHRDNTRGTGCVLAASIATAWALNHSLIDAIVIGKMQINQAIENGYRVGLGKGPLKPLSWPSKQRYMPKLSDHYQDKDYSFPDCGVEEIGLYPVVDSVGWIERLLKLGVTTIQLRVKDLAADVVEEEIVKSIQIAEKYKARLFINDYWQLAIKHKAYGVHLGQEDLDNADLEAISKAGLRLGISTHCYYEVARAHAIKPSYMACGPVYHTESKQMPWIPHGIENLSYWVNTMDEYPWVAIGGIDLGRLTEVARTKVSGVAMISAITQAEEPEQITLQMMQQLSNRI